MKAGAASAERMAAEEKAGTIQPGSAGPVGSYVKIPGKYSSVKTSGLLATLENGQQVKDFDLTD